MRPEDAGRIVQYLNAAFPRNSLDPAALAVFTQETTLLFDHAIAFEAARAIVRDGDHFPTIRRLREAYREIAEPRQFYKTMPQIEPPRGPSETPEWVQVWFWVRNTLRQRDKAFPQQTDERGHSLLPDRPTMSWGEYEELRSAYQRAGAPVVDVGGLL